MGPIKGQDIIKQEKYKMAEEEKPIRTEELFVDPTNIEALTKALKPKRGIYSLTMPSGEALAVPYHETGHVYNLESTRGEHKVKESDKIDPTRERRIWIRRINKALEDGWRVVDDLLEGPKKSLAEYLLNKEIPVSIINSEDWATMVEVCFPGIYDDTSTIQDRAKSIRMRAS